MWFCKLNWLHYQFNAMNMWWWTSGRKKFILGYFLIEKSICGIGLTNSIPKLGIFLNEVNVNIIKKMVKNNGLYTYFLKNSRLTEWLLSFSQQVSLCIRSLVMVCIKMRQNKTAILTCMQALLYISIWDKFTSVKCPLMSILWVLRTNLETNPRLACLWHREDLGELCLCYSPAAPQRRGPLSRVSSRQGSLCWFPIERCSRKAWEILPITWNSYIQDFFFKFWITILRPFEKVVWFYMH